MVRQARFEVIGLVLCLFGAGCAGAGADGTPGADGLSSLVSVSAEPAGANCARGGVRVESGQDLDANGVLDPDEVTDTSFVCAGADGRDGTSAVNGLVVQSEEPMGDNCPLGGVRIDSGRDLNGNGTLDPDEVEQSNFICADQTERFSGLIYVDKRHNHLMGEVFRATDDGLFNQRLAASPEGYQQINQLQLSPDGRYLSYMTFEIIASGYGNSGLYVLDVQRGTAPVRVSIDPLPESDIKRYAWAPDSSRLAYIGDMDTVGKYEVYTVFPDGTGHTGVSHLMAGGGDGAFSLGWSPDSSRVAYMGDMETAAVRELFVANADGIVHTKISQPAPAGGGLNSFRWAPDGSRIAYLGKIRNTDNRELYTVAPDGSGHTRVSRDPVAANSGVVEYDWSPDSQRITYSGNLRIASCIEAFVVGGDGRSNTRVSVDPVAGAAGVGNAFTGTSLGWAPDGSRVAYVGRFESTEEWQLYSASPGGAERLRISDPAVNGVYVGEFQWAPDGGRIVFRSTTNVVSQSALYAVTPDGSDLVALSRGAHPDANVGGVAGSGYYEISPDGSKVAYRGDMLVDALDQLFVVDIDGSNHRQVSRELAGNVSNMGWSPGGDRIAYTGESNERGQTLVFVVNPDGTDDVLISTAERDPDAGWGAWFSLWVP
jgi:Tol biopolymer transport system component